MSALTANMGRRSPSPFRIRGGGGGGGLQSMLNHLSTYCKANGLEINEYKTKCIIFNKTGRLLRRKFYFARDKLENVRSYTYLGFIFAPSGEIKTALSDDSEH